jgi:RNA polymerase sigma factor (sigma-70 family)
MHNLEGNMENGDIIEKIIKAKQGDKEALEYIIKRFTPFIIKTARSIYINGQDIEDLIQIGKISVMKAVDKYDITRVNGFVSYVMSAVTRNFYNLIRSRVRQGTTCSLNSQNSEGFELMDSLQSDFNMEEDYEKREEKLMLMKVLEKLSKEEGELINWIYFKNKTLEKYAREKDICYKTALNRKKKVLIKLRDFLDKSER